MKVSLIQITPVFDHGCLRAFADVHVEYAPGPSFNIRWCRIIQQPGQRAYLALPQHEDRGRFYPVISGGTELREAIEGAVLPVWEAKHGA